MDTSLARGIILLGEYRKVVLQLPNFIVFIQFVVNQGVDKARKMRVFRKNDRWGCSKCEVAGSLLYLGQNRLFSVVALESMGHT